MKSIYVTFHASDLCIVEGMDLLGRRNCRN
jgi:hypothetical protein